MLFTRDGRTLISCSEDTTIKLWDVATGAERGVLGGHSQKVMAIALSSDDKTLASAGLDKSIRLWNIETKEPIATLEGHAELVRSLSFSGDGKRLVSASADRTARIWNVDERREIVALNQGAEVYGVAFSPTENEIAAGCADFVVRIWDLGSKKTRLHLRGHNGVPWHVIYSPDGQRIATAAFDGQARIWNSKSPVQIATYDAHEGWCIGVAFSPDGRRLATCGGDHLVKIWNAPDTPVVVQSLGSIWRQFQGGPEIATYGGHLDKVEKVAFSTTAPILASGSADGAIKLWSTAHASAYPPHSGDDPFFAHLNSVYLVSFSDDGRRVVTVGADRSLREWEPETGRLLRSTPLLAMGSEFVAAQKGNVAITWGEDRSLQLWKRKQDWQLERRIAGGSSVLPLAIAAEAPRFVRLLGNAAQVNAAQIVDFAEDPPMARQIPVSQSASHPAVDPAGERLAIVTAEKVINIIDLASGVVESTLSGHTNYVEVLKFSPDGKTLASASLDHTVRVWDVAAQKQRHVLRGHNAQIGALAFSPDGRTLASASSEGQIRFWDPETGQERYMFDEHSYAVTAMSFSPDGRMFVSGDGAGKVVFWWTDAEQSNRYMADDARFDRRASQLVVRLFHQLGAKDEVLARIAEHRES